MIQRDMSSNAKFGMVAACLLLVQQLASGQALLDGQITYQGMIVIEGAPLTTEDGNPCTMTFKLYNDETGGALIGTAGPVPVGITNGLFTVSDLNFGTSAFSGEPRYLELTATCPVDGSMETETFPRQALTSAPYALHTRGIYVDSDGNVGIGASQPHRPLHAKGNGGLLALEGSNYSYLEFYPEGLDAAAPMNNRKGWMGWGSAETTTLSIKNEIPEANLRVSSDHIHFERHDGDADTWFPYTNGEVYVTSDLDGTGTGDLHFRTFSDADGYSDKLLIEGTTGNVGIGTVVPEGRLHIKGGTDSAPAGGGYLVLASTDGANLSIDNNEIMARNNGVPSTLYLNNDGGNVRVAANGTGRLIAPVLEITGGADLAEKFPVSEEVAPGMVVEIDPNEPGRLRLSRERYNRRVAGIVSGAGDLPAGAILGNMPGTESAPAIALSGRVWVHCNTLAGGRIEPGDLLTTSDITGYAMKATDPARSHGAIIGKAMTGLSQDRGLVLVLVSLQ